jgi:hypothetical protein
LEDSAYFLGSVSDFDDTKIPKQPKMLC